MHCYLDCRDFDTCLKTIKWPNVGTSNEVFAPSKHACYTLSVLAEYLFLVGYAVYSKYMKTN